MQGDITLKLGQLFFVGFQGYTLSKKTKAFLHAIQPGGIIFFENNIKDKSQVKNLIKEINSCLKIRPFIAVDQEGGSVERLRKICTSLPSVWGLSKVGLKELLSSQEIIATELLELGFNMVLGPVLDINSNYKNPVIGTRSISNNPTIVSEYGVKVVELFLKNKIVPVVKHFPGHGDLNIDSHLNLPVLNKSKARLNNFELLPFKKTIQNKAPVVMVGHIQLPQVEPDKKLPSSLSKNVLNILRKDLGFKGLIITDELNMKGITKNFPLQIASQMALNAGVDLLLYNHNEKSTTGAYEYIKGRLLKDKSLLKRIEESYKRITVVKKKYVLRGKRNDTAIRRNGETAKELARKVVHWIKKDLFFTPVSLKDTIDVIYPHTPKLREEDLHQIFKELKIKKYSLICYRDNPAKKDINKIRRKINKKNKKILITYNVASKKGQKNLVKALLYIDPNSVVILAGLEHDIELIPGVRNSLAAYGPNYISLLAAFEKLLT